MKSNWNKLRQENANVVADVQQLADRQQALTDFQVNLNQQQIAIAQKYQHNFDGLQQLLNDRKDLATVAYKVGDAASRVDEIVAKYADDFKTATKLRKKDFVFLFTATALQVLRQYLFSRINNYRSSDRLDDQAAAKKEGHGGKYDRSTRGSGYYHATVEEMLNNSVPFDTQNASALFGENLGGGWGHRFHTLGHDPILGWIFGTANIATRTVTMSDIVSSYHVRYGQYMTGNQTLSVRPGDYFAARADTYKVLKYGLVEPAKHLDNHILAKALSVEATHLLTDIDSKASLSLPGLEVISPEFAEKLSRYGLNMHNLTMVGAQAGVSVAINTLVAMIHRLMYDAATDGDERLYEVRTRKIISYSNMIASASNIVYVAVVSAFGDADAINSLDIGGLLVTIVTVLRNGKVQEDIFEEFMANRWYQDIMDL